MQRTVPILVTILVASASWVFFKSFTVTGIAVFDAGILVLAKKDGGTGPDTTWVQRFVPMADASE